MKIKKSLNICLFVLLGFLLFPMMTNAATGAKVELECSGREEGFVESEKNVVCTVKLNIPEDEVGTTSFKKIAFNVGKDIFGDEAEVELVGDDISMTGKAGETVTVTKKNNGLFSNSETLVMIKNVTMPDISKATYEKGVYNYIIKLTNIVLTDNADKNLTNSAELKVRLLSKDATLSSITFDGNALADFNSNGSIYKYTCNEDKVTLSVKATNQNSKIEIGEKIATKEIKDHKIALNYGTNNITIKVTSESGAEKTYIIHTFRPYYLFPGFDFEFDSKDPSYNYTIGTGVTKFAVCSNSENGKFVVKADTLCFNINVINDIYEIGNYTTYFNSLKLNGVNLGAKYADYSEKQLFDAMEIMTDENGNQTKYINLGTINPGKENTLKFSIDKNYPEYTVVLNSSGNKAPSSNIGTSTVPSENAAGNDVNKPHNNNVNKPSNNNNEVADSTVESPKTGIVTYTLAILGVAGIAGGVYYYLNKKKLIKKI